MQIDTESALLSPISYMTPARRGRVRWRVPNTAIRRRRGLRALGMRAGLGDLSLPGRGSGQDEADEHQNRAQEFAEI